MNAAVFGLNAESTHRANCGCGQKPRKFSLGMAKRGLLYRGSVTRLVELDQVWRLWNTKGVTGTFGPLNPDALDD